MKGASLFHVARKMHQRGAFTLPQAAGMAWKQFKFVLRGENMDDVHAVRDSALTLAAGFTEEDIEALGEEVYDEMIDSRIWPGAKALAEQHLRVGRKVWLVTATPIEVATVISTRLGLTGALGTVGEILDGFYTGRLVGDILHGAAKAVAVQGIAEAEGLDLKRCWAYSDSLQRHPAADHGGPSRGHQPGRPAPQARPRTQLAGLRFPLRPPRRHPGPQGRHRRRGHLRPLAGLLPLPRPHALSSRDARSDPRHQPWRSRGRHDPVRAQKKMPAAGKATGISRSAKYLYFLLRRWWRVLRSNLRCFFLAIRLRRFLITEPTKVPYRLDAVPACWKRSAG